MKQILCLACLGIAAMAAAIAIAAEPAAEPPWADYVRTPDKAFQWTIHTRTVDKYVSGEVNMTSQVWHGATWKHGMQILAPKKSASPDTALLYINGSSGPLPQMVEATGLTCAIVGSIPITSFSQEGDNLGRYSVMQYLASGDATWVLPCPMVTTVVRAMDVLQEVSAKEFGGQIKRFILVGHSKLGLTAWFAAVIDPRVVGIVPVGAELLNIPGQAVAGAPFLKELAGNPQLLQAAAGAKFFATIDPYVYRDKLKIPKLLVSGTNDEHFLLNAPDCYWAGLPSPKSLVYLDNSTHANQMSNQKAVQATYAFARAIAAKKELPQLKWTCTDSGKGLQLQVVSPVPVKSATLYSAVETGGSFAKARWGGTPMKTEEPKKAADGVTVVGEVAKPAAGRVAAYAELEFADEGHSYWLTTAPAISKP